MIPFLLALKSIRKILNKKNKLIYQIKWVVLYGEDIVNIYYLSIVKKKKRKAENDTNKISRLQEPAVFVIRTCP